MNTIIERFNELQRGLEHTEKKLEQIQKMEGIVPKVYCNNCKYLCFSYAKIKNWWKTAPINELFTFWYRGGTRAYCDALENRVLIDTPKKVVSYPKRNPTQINRFNDCKWYEGRE